MKILAGLLSVACLSGCATTALPPQLADPAAHVRPVTRGVTPLDMVPATLRPVRPGVPCERERHAALVNRDGARADFAKCLVSVGDSRRAASVVQTYLPERTDILARAIVREEIRSAPSTKATRRTETRVLQADAHIANQRDPMSEAGLNTLLETTPHDPWVWMALGREYERQGRDAEAVDAYLIAKSLEAAP